MVSAYTLSATAPNTQGYLIQTPLQGDYSSGTTVTLYAGTRQGYRFANWMGDVQVGQETANPLILTMDTTKTLMATFGFAPSGMVQAWGYNSNDEFIIPSPNSDFVAVAGGARHSLGLKSDGSIVAWGHNPCTVPSPNSDFMAIAAGEYHSLGLKPDGSIVAWGQIDNGLSFVPATPPSPNSDFVALAASTWRSLGLKSDGSIVVWGDNIYGQHSVPSPNSGFVAVAAGYSHSLGLKSDGSLVVWRTGLYGQSTVPSPNSGFVAISAGDAHSLGLKSDGSIVAWGDNDYGQCTVPSPNSGFVAIATGGYHNLGLRSDGSIVAWGDSQSTVPSPNSGFVAIAEGYTHSQAIVANSCLQVIITPPEAVAAGAQWRLTSEAPGVWHESADTVVTRVGPYTLTFKDVYGWVKPADQLVEVLTSETVLVTGAYNRIIWPLSTASENGSILISPLGTSFPHGTSVTLTATPAVGYHFTGWSGTTTSTSNPLVVTMDSTKTLTANFAINQYALVVEAVHGSLVKSPNQATYSYGTSVTLTATPTVGYHFTGWSGTTTSTSNPLVVTMDSTKTLTANFAINQYALVVEAVHGSLVKSPNQATYSYGTSVTLTATPAVGYHFTDWSGTTTSTSNPLVVTMDSTKTLTANFAINQYALVVEAVHGSLVKSPNQATYSYGTSVTLTATPAVGYHFTDWSGTTTSTSNPLVVTMDSTKTLTANFAINEYTLIYTAGTNGTISGSTSQTVDYGYSGTSVEAVPVTGYHFVQWSDDSMVNPRTDTNVTTNISVIATFAINEYALTVEAVNGSVAKSPDQTTYTYGTTVTLTATPAVGYHFTGWSGSVTTTDNPLVVTMDATETLTANFAINVVRNGTRNTWHNSVQNAVDMAFSGDVIVVMPGTYYENVTISGKNIILRSTDPASTETVANTILDGRYADSVIQITDADVTIDGFTILHGYCIDWEVGHGGGGIYATSSGTVTIVNNIVKENGIESEETNISGGGIYCGPGIHSVIVGNTLALNRVEGGRYSTSLSGGGAYVTEGIVSGNRFTSNSVLLAYSYDNYYVRGGGLFCDRLSTITYNLMQGNTIEALHGYWDGPPSSGTAEGGGMYAPASAIASNVIESNTCHAVGSGPYLHGTGNGVARGGGIYAPEATLKKNTILANAVTGVGGCASLDWGAIPGGSGTGEGGGAYVPRATLDSNVLLGNSASAKGGHADARGWGGYSWGAPGGDCTATGGGAYGFQSTLLNNVIASNFTKSIGGDGKSSVDPAVEFPLPPPPVSGGHGIARGAGVYAEGASLANNTVLDNNAAGTGGSGDGGGPSGSSVAEGAGGRADSLSLVTNTIFWGNSPDQLQGYSPGNVNYCDIAGGVSGGVGNILTDPSFVASYRLSPASPCIDAGGSVALTTDFEGDTRPVNGTSEPRGDGSDFDIGADEYVGLVVEPRDIFVLSGPEGGPFSPVSKVYTLSNTGESALNWTVSKTAAWLDLSGSASGTLASGASVAVTVSVNSGANTLAVGIYTDTLTFTNATLGISETQDIQLTVVAARYTLGLTANPSGGGTISASPVPGSDGKYVARMVVILTATPTTGYHFTGWSGAVTSTLNPIEVTMDAAKTLTATFDLIPTYTVTVVADPTDSGTVSKSPDQVIYANGTSVALTAVAADGFTFRGWTDGTTTISAATSFQHTVADADKTFTAKFKAIPTYTVTVMANPANGGTVTKLPDQAIYTHGTSVTITATPAVGYHFTSWSGSATSLTNPLVVTMDSTKTLTANFAINEYALTVEAVNGSVAKSPDQTTYTYGTTVTLTAMPAVGYHFTGWSGSATIMANPLVVTMDAAKTLMAHFATNLPPPNEVTVYLPGNVPLVLVSIPSGSFQMGSPDTERSRSSDEGPVHTVNIGYEFYMGKYEVTQEQWQAIMGSNPARNYGVGENYPVYNLSWDDICDPTTGFLKKLNDYFFSMGLGQVTMRLPSEAEWEYACRAGTQTRFFFGDSLLDASGNPLDDIHQDGPAGVLPGNRSDYMWWESNASGANPVGRKLPNQFGLYDMYGNVWEWCQDFWHDNYMGAPTDGSVWQGTSLYRVFRGGSWLNSTHNCRSANRYIYTQNNIYNSFGLRLLTSTDNFSLNDYRLTVNAASHGSVAKSPDLVTYTHGTTVTLTATPEARYHFTGWMGDIDVATSLTNPLIVTMDSTKTLTANFAVNDSQLLQLGAALISMAITPQSGNTKVHWGEVWTKSDVNMPAKSQCGHIDKTSGSYDPFVSYRTEGSLLFDTTWKVGAGNDIYDPVNRTSPGDPPASGAYSDKPLLPDGTYRQYTQLDQHVPAGTLKWPDLLGAYEDFKVAAKQHGRYYGTDAAGNIYRDGIEDAAHLVDFNTEFGNADTVNDPHDHVFIDTIDGTAPKADGSNLATILNSGTGTGMKGIFWIGANMVQSSAGNPANLMVESPAAGHPKVNLAKVYLNGVLYSAGYIDVTGNPVVYGSVVVQKDFRGTGTFDVWYNWRLKDGLYAINEYSLTVNAAHGSVAKSPDQAVYIHDSLVTLTAIPETGYHFTGWTGDVTTSTNPLVLEMDVAKTITATFTINQYTLTYTADAKGSIYGITPQTVDYGGSGLPVEAIPDTGYGFLQWSDGSTSNPRTETNVTTDVAVTAIFDEQYTVAFQTDGTPGASLTGVTTQKVIRSGDCTPVAAVGLSSYYFVKWTLNGADYSTDNPLNVNNVTQNMSLRAIFAERSPIIWVNFGYSGVPRGTPTEPFPTLVGGLAAVEPGGTIRIAAGQTSECGRINQPVRIEAIGGTVRLGVLGIGGSDANSSPMSTENPLTEDPENTLTAPTSVTAVGNTYMILVHWTPVTGATGYSVTRVAGTSDTMPVTWTVGLVTEFADDTAVPGVPYSYTVTAFDAQGNPGTPSETVTAAVTAETVIAANYKVTARGYTMARDSSNNLTFTGSKTGTIKIMRLKREHSGAVDEPAKGIYYLKNLTQVPALTVTGDVKTLAFDVPVYSLEASGLVKSVSAKSVTFLKAREFGSISIRAKKPSDLGLYARTFIETAGTSSVAMSIKSTGAVIEEVGSMTGTGQPVKLLSVASKVYRGSAQGKKMSLGAVGSLPKVVAEVRGVPAPASEATPSSIRGRVLKVVTISGGSVVAEELVGLIDRVTVSGGNLRPGLIQSDKDLELLQAMDAQVNGVLRGGAVGTAGNPLAMVVKAKNSIRKVLGQTGISGYFYAGFDAKTGLPTKSSGIGILQTKTGTVEGAALLNQALVSKMKVLPQAPTPPIVINPVE